MINRNALLIIIITGTCAFRPKGGKFPTPGICGGVGKLPQLSRRPDARTMSRRKQAKPQHINSEEDQGEQQPQQPAPEFADAAPAAPTAGEPGEWGSGRTAGARSFRHVRGTLEGAGFGELAASSADSGTEIWGLSCREERQLHSPPPPPLLILHFYRFPSLV